jgi:hypothetical protein
VEINNLTGAERGESDLQVLAKEIRNKIQATLEIPALRGIASLESRRNYKSAIKLILNHLSLEKKDIPGWGVLIGWDLTHTLGRVMGEDGAAARSQTWIDEWLLGRILVSSMMDLGISEFESWRSIGLIKILIQHQDWYLVDTPKRKRAYRIISKLFEDENVREYLQINRYQGILWFNQESFEDLLAWLMRIAVINIYADQSISSEEPRDQITNIYQTIRKIKRAESKSNFQVERLLDELG